MACFRSGALAEVLLHHFGENDVKDQRYDDTVHRADEEGYVQPGQEGEGGERPAVRQATKAPAR